MRSTIPGGLRAQLLLGFSILLVGSFALGALIVENVLTRRLLAARETHVHSIAEVAAQLPHDARVALVTQGVVDAIVDGPDAYGEPGLVETLRGSTEMYVAHLERRYVRVEAGPVVVAARVDDLRSSVESARTMLLLFGLLVAVVVLALGYGFFSFVVVRPIRAIGVATERAAHGDFVSPIQRVARNEIGNVALSFNEMLRRIEEGRLELQQRVDEANAANIELKSTRDSLVRSEKLASVGQLAAGIAHEIGNPLAALSGYNDLMRDGDLDPDEQLDLLNRSGAQLDRIRSVIRNLLDFSREEQDAEPCPTELARCVDETVSLVRVGSRTREIRFEVESMAGPAAMVVGSQLVQVLVNLAMNAADALAPTGGVVRFRRVDEPEWAILSIEDDGPGVPEAIASRIFDPFFTTKEPGDGTGLGLAISARILESFGGSITVGQSELGGAKFELRLPTKGNDG